VGVVKLLFLADSHLGFDYPFRPRIKRRRRGEDFFKNYERALEPARKGEVHAVIHGGDLLFRSKVRAQLVDMAMMPLKEIADQGVKIYLVPGNHERSRIPFGILSMHPNIHIFWQPSSDIANHLSRLHRTDIFRRKIRKEGIHAIADPIVKLRRKTRPTMEI